MKTSNIISRLTAALLLVTFCLGMAACGQKNNGREAYYEAKASLNVPNDTWIIDQFKEMCQELADFNAQEVFISATFTDGENNIKLHCLTKDNEYKIFTIQTPLNGPLVLALQGHYGDLNEQDQDVVYNFIKTASVNEINEDTIIFN